MMLEFLCFCYLLLMCYEFSQILTFYKERDSENLGTGDRVVHTFM